MHWITIEYFFYVDTVEVQVELKGVWVGLLFIGSLSWPSLEHPIHPWYKSPWYKSPWHKSHLEVLQPPWYKSPLYKSPWYKSPWYKSPWYKSPMVQVTPGSPTLEVLSIPGSPAHPWKSYTSLEVLYHPGSPLPPWKGGIGQANSPLCSLLLYLIDCLWHNLFL